MSGRAVRLEAKDLDSVCARLGDGEVLLLPTDTVHGLCCDPTNQEAIDRLLAIKGRGRDVPMAVLVSGWVQAKVLAVADSRLEAMDRLAWPATLTVVAARLPTSRLGLGLGVDTVGLRRPGASLIADVVRRFGPVCATSANRHGHAPQTRLSDVLEELRGAGPVGIDAYVAAEAGATLASTVVKIHDDGWELLRAGATGESVIETLLGPGPRPD